MIMNCLQECLPKFLPGKPKLNLGEIHDSAAVSFMMPANANAGSRFSHSLCDRTILCVRGRNLFGFTAADPG